MSKCKLLKPVTYVQYLDIAFLQLSHVAVTVKKLNFLGKIQREKKVYKFKFDCLPNFM
jgi:hypothetical protein